MKNLLRVCVTLFFTLPLWSLDVKDFFTVQITKTNDSYQLVYQLNNKHKEVVDYNVSFQILDAKGTAVSTITPLPLSLNGKAAGADKLAYKQMQMPLNKEAALLKFLATNAPYTIVIKDLGFVLDGIKLYPNYFKSYKIELFENRPYLILDVNPQFHKDIGYEASFDIKGEKTKVIDTIAIKHKNPAKSYNQRIEKYSKALFDLLTNKQKLQIEVKQLLVQRKIAENGALIK